MKGKKLEGGKKKKEKGSKPTISPLTWPEKISDEDADLVDKAQCLFDHHLVGGITVLKGKEEFNMLPHTFQQINIGQHVRTQESGVLRTSNCTP